MKNLFQYSWMTGLALALLLYGTQFDNLSETELVRWSYVWLPILIFGVVGSIAMKKGITANLDNPFRSALTTAVKWTLIGMALLILFYESLWHEL